MKNLAEKKCKPCEGGVDPLTAEQSKALLKALHKDWVLVEEQNRIERLFSFPSFARNIAFVNAVAFIATNEGHHPELHVTYRTCRVSYTTTAISGLSDNDFICAAKIDRLLGAG